MSKEYPCAYYRKGMKCALVTDGIDDFCTMGPGCPNEKPSHGDQIRQKTDEELAELITPIYSCAQCPLPGEDRKPCGTDGMSCRDRVLEWLKEATE